MERIIKLTESDLSRIVKRIIKEEKGYPENTKWVKINTCYQKKTGEGLPESCSTLINDTSMGKNSSKETIGGCVTGLGTNENTFMNCLTNEFPGFDTKIFLKERDLHGMVEKIIGEGVDSEEDLINATYDLMYDLGDEDVEILDLRDAANILDEELYEGNHGPVMEERIEDLLTRIEYVIGYPDYEEGEDIEDHL